MGGKGPTQHIIFYGKQNFRAKHFFHHGSFVLDLYGEWMIRPLTIETAAPQDMPPSVTQEKPTTLTPPHMNTPSQLPLKDARIHEKKKLQDLEDEKHRASDTHPNTSSLAAPPQEAFPEALDTHSIRTLEDVIAYLEKNNTSSQPIEGQRMHTETGEPLVTIQWHPHQAKDQLVFNTSPQLLPAKAGRLDNACKAD